MTLGLKPLIHIAQMLAIFKRRCFDIANVSGDIAQIPLNGAEDDAALYVSDQRIEGYSSKHSRIISQYGSFEEGPALCNVVHCLLEFCVKA